MTSKTEMVHELRIQAVPFEDLLSGVKTGEVRNSDRGFKVGDSVLLNEVSGAFPVPTGRQMRRTITHIQTGYGLPDGIVVLSYAPAEDVRAVVEEPVGKMLSDAEMGIGYDRKFGRVIWFGTPEPGLLYRHPQRPVVLPADESFFKWLNDSRFEHTPYFAWRAAIELVERLSK